MSFRHTDFHSTLLLTCTVAALVAAAPPGAPAQQQDSATADADTTERASSRLRVFLDCPRFVCDSDHVRRQITYVEWVRDRQLADVQIIVTRQGTSGGGERITADFVGRDEFEGRERRLQYTASASEPEQETREGVVRILEQGLLGYLAGRPAAEQLDVVYRGEQTEGGETTSPAEDPWNRWVFETSVGGFLNDGGRRTSYSLDGGLSANRTTKEWKIDLGLSGSYERSEFLIPRGGDTTEVVSTEERLEANTLLVNSLGPHWSIGGHGSVGQFSRRNQDLAVTAGPALEWNLFPYAQSTRRQLTVLYAVTGNAYSYRDSTVFGKLSEQRLRHTLNVSFDVTEPWGEIGVSVEGRHFLDDIEQNRLTLSGSLQLQVVEGLSIRLFGSGSRVRDQIYLSREEVSPSEVFTGEREFATDFEYRASLNLSYTFGSALSDVVNTRFDGLGGGGGGSIIFF